MKKFFLLVFLLLVPLALASTVNTNQAIYTPSEAVTITITGCVGSTILTISNPYANAVFSDQGNNNWQTTYHTSSDPSTGTYTINAFCGPETFSTSFVVEEPTPIDDDEPANGGGGGSCQPEWSCGYWNVCGVDLIQKRTCIDLKYCEPQRIESRACSPCIESWICSLWSKCLNQKQTRKCYDQRHCGTITRKPILQKPCNTPDTGYPPAQVVPVPPDQFPPEEEIPGPSFWEKYKVWLITLPLILILLLVALFLFLRFYRPKKNTNVGPLTAWVRNALAKGISEQKIRETLHKQTKWTDKEINQAFGKQ